MKKLLLTGFEPFLGFSINPTEKIVNELNKRVIGDYVIEGVLLPVDFQEAPEQLLAHFNRLIPDAVISLGLAAGRNDITPERIAINCRDGEPDNKGNQLVDSPIYEDGSDGYFSTLPIRKFTDTLNKMGYPSTISNTAGTYLCNNVMYTLLHHLKQKQIEIPAGFIHVPASHDLAIATKKSIASWSQLDLQRAIETIIEVL